MKELITIILLVIFPWNLYSQNHGSVSGMIKDRQTEQALAGATVTIKGTSTSVVDNKEGKFIFTPVQAGKIILIISHVGYDTREITAVISLVASNIINVALELSDRVGNEVVVSASKKAEKITDAPASIQVIGIKELQQFAGSNMAELASRIQGLEFVRSGVDFIAFNARGFNRAINNKFFQMVDGRNTMSPLGPGLPLVNIGTAIKDDIEKIEIILGPQSALFGPNVHNGLFSVTTKDPRKYQGTTVSISAGNQQQLSSRLRHAAKINNKWAYKLIGEYASGKDFTFYDSVYAGGGAFGPAVAIPERNLDFNFRHARGEAHLYYSLTTKSDIIVSSGASNNNFIGVSNAGRNQMRGLRNSFLQARFIHPRFFLNIYNAWGNFGESYSIADYTRNYWNRTHNSPPASADSAEKYAMVPFRQHGQRINVEAQYNHNFTKAGIFFVAGLSYQKEKPVSFGNGLLDSASRIYVRQVGAVLQTEKTLPLGMRFVAAARFDNHDNYGNFFSPKLAFVKNAGNCSFRITWAKGYSMPGILFQYTNSSGRIFGNGPGITYIPNLSKISEPSYKTTTSLKPEQISTWEFGYKGSITKKLYIDVNYYNGHSKNFLSSPLSVQGRAVAVGDIPVKQNPAFAGTVINDTLYGASFLSYFNYGDVKAYGIDLGLQYSFSKIISLAIKYSWFGSNITKGSLSNDANKNNWVAEDEKSLNAPANTGAATLSFQKLLKQKMFVNISARLVEKYDFYTGTQLGTSRGKGKRGVIYQGPGSPPTLANFDHGPLGGFSTIDLSAGYMISKMINVNIGISNVFNTDQHEFVASPSIGRLIMIELRVHIPNGKK